MQMRYPEKNSMKMQMGHPYFLQKTNYQAWRAWNAAIEVIFGRWELVVVDNVYIRNGSGSNIGAQTYNNYQSRYTSQSIDQSQLIFPLLDVLVFCSLDRVSYRLSKLSQATPGRDTLIKLQRTKKMSKIL
jgi:hypothetical protein